MENRHRVISESVNRPALEHQGRLMANAGDQMAAVGVYPSNMEDVLSLRAISSTNIVWNTFLRWYFLPHFAELPMIQNNWRTANYRIAEDGRIECDSVANWAWDVHFNKSICSGRGHRPWLQGRKPAGGDPRSKYADGYSADTLDGLPRAVREREGREGSGRSAQDCGK